MKKPLLTLAIVGLLFASPCYGQNGESDPISTTRIDDNRIGSFLGAYTDAGKLLCNDPHFHEDASASNHSVNALGVGSSSAKYSGQAIAVGNSFTTTIPAPQVTAGQTSIDMGSGHIVFAQADKGDLANARVESLQDHQTVNRVEAGLVEGDGYHTLHSHLHLILHGSNTENTRVRTFVPYYPYLLFGSYVFAQVGDSTARAEYIGDDQFLVTSTLATVDFEGKGGEGLPEENVDIAFGCVNDHFFAEQLVRPDETFLVTCYEDTLTAVSLGPVGCFCEPPVFNFGVRKDIWQYKAFGFGYVTDDE